MKDKQIMLLAVIMVLVAICTVFLALKFTSNDGISGLDSVADGISEVGEVYVHPDP
jgi:hypothetical protein